MFTQPTRRSLTLLLAAIIALAPSAILSAQTGKTDSKRAAPAGESEAKAKLRASFEGLKRAMRLAQSSISEIPADTFDPKAVLRETGSSPDAIYAWVRNNTDLIAYAGVLRGWRGVLMDRMGNGIDRALLLAELLKRARPLGASRPQDAGRQTGAGGAGRTDGDRKSKRSRSREGDAPD